MGGSNDFAEPPIPVKRAYLLLSDPPAGAAYTEKDTSMVAVHPSRSARAILPNAAVTMANRSLARAAVCLAAVVMLLVCCISTVDAKEIKGLGFYPPFQTFNARGVIGCVRYRLLDVYRRCCAIAAGSTALRLCRLFRNVPLSEHLKTHAKFRRKLPTGCRITRLLLCLRPRVESTRADGVPASLLLSVCCVSCRNMSVQ